MIGPITSIKEKEIALDAWRKIFRTTDPFSWPFQPYIRSGRVLFPTDGYYLTKLQYQSLMHAIADTGEYGFLLAIVESDMDYLKIDQNIWNCGMPKYSEYCDMDIPLENAFFSLSGRWGIIISHEMHGVLGADRGFLSSFNESAGDGVGERNALELRWAGVESHHWLEALLEHTA